MNLLTRRRNRGGDDRSRDWLRELCVELERARRYERPFALVRVPLERPRGRPHRDDCRRVTSTVRKVDHCWLADGSLYVLLPESTRPAAEGLVARMGEDFPELRLDEAQIACFPDDAVTAGALLDAVRQHDPPVVDRGRPERRLRQLTPAAELRHLRDARGGG